MYLIEHNHYIEPQPGPAADPVDDALILMLAAIASDSNNGMWFCR
jgi:hypothetical protein